MVDVPAAAGHDVVVREVEYSCFDGSPFPVTFLDAGDVELRWVIDREHSPTAMSPLADAVRRIGRPGAERAFVDSGVPIPSWLLREPPLANGFDYVADVPMPADEREEFAPAIELLTVRHGGTLGVWHQHSLPRAEAACTQLREAPIDTTFAELARLRELAWGHTTVAGIVSQRDIRAVVAACTEMFGGGAELVAHRLAQGYGNDTIDADTDLWSIAGLEPGSVAAGVATRAFLDDSGSVATSWSIDHPTLEERPDLLHVQLGLLRRHPQREIAASRRDAVERRAQLAADVVARLPNAEARQRFERAVSRLDAFVPVREARARWQLVASGLMRRAVRARGAVLAERGMVDVVDDVFFMTPTEYDRPPRDVRGAIAARRAEQERWASVIPPATIGAASHDRTPATPGLLKGAPGAPGRTTGTARVIRDLVDAHRLEPDDVLVAAMTSPPWTPLFGIVTAVVTDSGDVLSHVAIAAREYGIPCVVGTGHATAVLTDGARVTVDGDAGTVQMHGPHRR